MRRSIQDLVSNLDPNVKIEPEVEDVSPHTSSHHTPVALTPSPRSGSAAALGHSGRVHRLGHKLWLPARQA